MMYVRECFAYVLLFIVSGLMLRSLIHFEFIFVYGVRKRSGFILLQVVQMSVLYICLFCYLAYRVIITIFLNSIGFRMGNTGIPVADSF